MKLLALAVLCLAILHSALGHFIINTPTTRGFSEETETQPFCGGFNTSSSSRTDVKINSLLQISVAIEDEHGTIVVFWAPGSNPSEADFKTTSQQLAVNANTNNGRYDLNLDIASIPSIQLGEATLQVIYESLFDNDQFDANFYQCIDINIISSAWTALPSTITLFGSLIYMLL